MVSPASLLRHAEKFGVDGCTDTAVECGYGVEELAALIEELDKIEAAHLKKRVRFYSETKRRLSYEERARRLLGIEDDTCSTGDDSGA